MTIFKSCRGCKPHNLSTHGLRPCTGPCRWACRWACDYHRNGWAILKTSASLALQIPRRVLPSPGKQPCLRISPVPSDPSRVTSSFSLSSLINRRCNRSTCEANHHHPSSQEQQFNPQQNANCKQSCQWPVTPEKDS